MLQTVDQCKRDVEVKFLFRPDGLVSQSRLLLDVFFELRFIKIEEYLGTSLVDLQVVLPGTFALPTCFEDAIHVCMMSATLFKALNDIRVDFLTNRAFDSFFLAIFLVSEEREVLIRNHEGRSAEHQANRMSELSSVHLLQ